MATKVRGARRRPGWPFGSAAAAGGRPKSPGGVARESPRPGPPPWAPERRSAGVGFPGGGFAKFAPEPRRAPRDGKFPQPWSPGLPEAAARRLPPSPPVRDPAHQGAEPGGEDAAASRSRSPRPLPSSLSFFPFGLLSFRFEWDVFGVNKLSRGK